MEGFLDGAPVLAKVTWAANEVALLNGEPTTYGLRAEIPLSGGGVTRYFVPWSAVSYLKQDIPAGAVAQAPVAVPPQTGKVPPTD